MTDLARQQSLMRKSKRLIGALVQLYHRHLLRRERRSLLLSLRGHHYLPNAVRLLLPKILEATPEVIVYSFDRRLTLMARGRQNYKIRFVIDRAAEMGDCVFIDIGASYGEFTVHLQPYVNRVVAVEANPIVARCLVETTKKFDNVRVEQVALSTDDGNCDMSFNLFYSGGGRIAMPSADAPQKAEPGSFVLSVPRRSARSWIAEELSGASDCIVKVDAEARDFIIIAQIIEKLISDVPNFCIMAEWNPGLLSDERQAIVPDLLRKCADYGVSVAMLLENGGTAPITVPAHNIYWNLTSILPQSECDVVFQRVSIRSTT